MLSLFAPGVDGGAHAPRSSTRRGSSLGPRLLAEPCDHGIKLFRCLQARLHAHCNITIASCRFRLMATFNVLCGNSASRCQAFGRHCRASTACPAAVLPWCSSYRRSSRTVLQICANSTSCVHRCADRVTAFTQSASAPLEARLHFRQRGSAIRGSQQYRTPKALPSCDVGRCVKYLGSETAQR